MSFNAEETKERIRAHIIDEYRVAPELLDGAVNLFERGIIDSLAVHGLIIFLEDTFDIKFEEKHFFDQKFTSIDGMVAIIADIKESKTISSPTDV